MRVRGERFAKERLGGGNATVFAQEKVNEVTTPKHRLGDSDKPWRFPARRDRQSNSPAPCARAIGAGTLRRAATIPS